MENSKARDSEGDYEPPGNISRDEDDTGGLGTPKVAQIITLKRGRAQVVEAKLTGESKSQEVEYSRITEDVTDSLKTFATRLRLIIGYKKTPFSLNKY